MRLSRHLMGSVGVAIVTAGTAALSVPSTAVAAASHAPRSERPAASSGATAETFASEGSWTSWSRYSSSPRDGSYYTPSNVKLRPGGVRLVGRAGAGRPVALGGLDSRYVFAQRFGHFSVTFRATGSAAYRYSLMLIPLHGNLPNVTIAAGRIGSHSAYAGYTYVDRRSGRPVSSLHSTALDATRYTTVGVAWGPDSIRYSIDGRVWASSSGTTIPERALMFALQVTEASARVAPPSGSSAVMQVASVGAARSTSSTAIGPNKVPMPVGNLPHFRQVVADDFRSGTLGRGWTVYSGHPGGGDLSDTWSAADVRVVDHQLELSAVRLRSGVWDSGGVNLSHLLESRYGLFEVRFRVGVGQGISYDANLWPEPGTRAEGQDFAESNGAPTRTWTYGTFHYLDAAGGEAADTHRLAVNATQWQTYGLEWTPGRLTWLIDGRPWATTRSASVPSTAMTLCLQIQEWSRGDARRSPWEFTSDVGTPSVVSMDVAWVVAYAYHGG